MSTLTVLPDPQIRIDRDGTVLSARFGDIYASRHGAIEQARQVYLQGCDLPRRWQGKDRFTMLELGFGLGVNFLATWQAWAADPQRSRTLHYVGIEGCPPRPQDWTRLPRQWHGSEPFLAAARDTLAAHWPAPVAGHHERELAEGQLRLTLVFADVRTALRQLQGLSAEAVYLDGFSPALNPDMFASDTLALLPPCLADGAHLSSYCAAGAVRRDLRALGCQAQRKPGFGGKWHRLQAVFQAAGHAGAASPGPVSTGPGKPV